MGTLAPIPRLPRCKMIGRASGMEIERNENRCMELERAKREKERHMEWKWAEKDNYLD